jgi:uncharacterized protein (DUF1330 family)
MGESMAVNPTGAQIKRLVHDSEAMAGEVVMLNLLKFREKAAGGEGSGADAYDRYAQEAVRHVTARGGRIVWMGRADAVVIGDDDVDDWDAVALVMYPSRSAFLDMIADPDYQQANVNREGGLERMKLIAMSPGAGFELNAPG